MNAEEREIRSMREMDTLQERMLEGRDTGPHFATPIDRASHRAICAEQKARENHKDTPLTPLQEAAAKCAAHGTHRNLKRYLQAKRNIT